MYLYSKRRIEHIDYIQLSIRKKIYYRFIREWRSLAGSIGIGSVPNFFLLGAQKAGTTSLFNYIAEYALNFNPPLVKEINFFTEKFARGPRYYRSFFPAYNRHRPITGEATPDYLFFPDCPERVSEMFPDARFIVILRNPIDRAFSQYLSQQHHYIHDFRDNRSFADAVRENEASYENGDSIDQLKAYKYFAYKKRGIYVAQLGRWFSFYSRDRFLIIDFDQLAQQTELAIQSVFRFLGLQFNQKSLTTVRRFNVTDYSTTTIDTTTRAYLSDYFRNYNCELFKLLGNEFNWD